LATYLGVSHCAALSSGTAAIHLALIILGVQREDEVICSSFTFAGTCNPIIYAGARPVFVDSESTTWNMDPDLLEEAILNRIKITGKKPKAIILVHLYGMPAMIDRIMQISRHYEIPVIEDAAEALGSSYHGRKLGTFGDLSVLSFNGNKIITTSGGGALLSNRGDWINKARFLATQARDSAPHYEHTHIGYNYRLSNICAGIGRGQLKVLDARVAQRRAIFESYQKAFEHTAGLIFQSEPEGYFSNRWLSHMLIYPTVFGDITRETLRLALEAKNIESRPLWKPMHLQPIYKDCSAFVNGVSEKLFNEGICLPSGTQMSAGQLNFVIEEIKRHLEM
jgi:dTDP-4-amino-4,6-dideoxygalactose transaminase